MKDSNKRAAPPRLGQFCEKHGEYAQTGACRWCEPVGRANAYLSVMEMARAAFASVARNVGYTGAHQFALAEFEDIARGIADGLDEIRKNTVWMDTGTPGGMCGCGCGYPIPKPHVPIEDASKTPKENP